MSVVKPVTRNTNWCSVDQVDGEDIVAGPAQVQWPNGSYSSEEIKIHVERSSVQDMGHSSTYMISHAYIETEWRGAEVQVWLFQSGISISMDDR